MRISIRKVANNIKFYIEDENEPSASIFDKGPALFRGHIIGSKEQADQMSQLMLIVGVFIESLKNIELNKNKKIFNILYIHSLTGEIKEGSYSPDNILRRAYSEKTVTVNTKEKIKFEFINFGFKDNKLAIIYRPVVW